MFMALMMWMQACLQRFSPLPARLSTLQRQASTVPTACAQPPIGTWLALRPQRGAPPLALVHAPHPIRSR